MKFTTIDQATFQQFAESSPYRSFMQTSEIAALREKNGWTAYYFGVEEAGKLLAATMAVAKPTFLGKSTFITPGGPLLDFANTSLTKFFLNNLRSYAKSHNGYLLQIDPYYEVIERGRDGNIVERGFNHTKATKTLQSLGFTLAPNAGQPKYLFILDLENQTTEQLFSDMKRNTRNHIRKAEKMGVKVRELSREELHIFKNITESTSMRRHFEDRPLSYYETMYDLFKPRNEVQFLVAEADGIPMSAAMFMTYGEEVIYLFSGSDEKYMKDYNAQYLIQWHMIEYAVKHGFKRYNFYGINGLPKRDSKDYGIYDFKKGFTSESTGRVVELLGAYETSLSPIYYLHQLLSKIKNLKK